MASNLTPFDSPIRIAREAKIVGGIEALPGEFPHQVAITYDDDFICGGSIINQLMILTAAHCVLSSFLPHKTLFKVIAGVHNLTFVGGSEQVRNIKSIYAHKNYSRENYLNDIAILWLSEPLRYTKTIARLELPKAWETFEGNATISGWGKTKYGGWGSVKLRKVSIPIVPRDVCQSRYKESHNITDNMLCIGGTGEDSCQGDSGGAAICLTKELYKVQCGIVSFGLGCGRKGVPGVYTFVSSYISWIQDAEKIILFMECCVNYLGIYSSWSPEFVLQHKIDDIKQTFQKSVQLYKNLSLKMTFDSERNGKIEIDSLTEKIRNLEQLFRHSHWEAVNQKITLVEKCYGSTRSTGGNSVISSDWLDDDTQISQFIKDAYRKFGKVEIFNFMVTFIDELPKCRHAKISAAAFAQVIKEEGDSKILSNLTSLRICTTDCGLMQTEICVHALKKCGELITSGMYQVIYEIINPLSPRVREQLIGYIIDWKNREAIIKNFQNVLDFAKGLSVRSDEVVALKKLYEVTQLRSDYPEMLLVLYRAKQLENEWMDGNAYNKIKDLMRWLPESIRALLFKPSVRIFNSEGDLTLAARKSNGTIYACKQQDFLFKYSDGYHNFSVHFEPEVIADKRCIMIKVKNSSYALACVDNAIQSVRYNYLGDIKSDSRFHWQPFLVSCSVWTCIYLKNRISGKILVEGEDVGDGCSSLETIDAYSNQRKALWKVS